MQAFFVRKCFVQLFSSCVFGFVIFWLLTIGTKAARKMSMKLTKGITSSNWRYVSSKLFKLPGKDLFCGRS
jgi:hypothetical protein